MASSETMSDWLGIAATTMQHFSPDMNYSFGGVGGDGRPYSWRRVDDVTRLDPKNKRQVVCGHDTAVFFHVATDLVSENNAHFFVEPTLGYEIPEILREIHYSLLTCPMRVGVSCLSEASLEPEPGPHVGYKKVAHLEICHPSKAKYLLLTLIGGKAECYSDFDGQLSGMWRTEFCDREDVLSRAAIMQFVQFVFGRKVYGRSIFEGRSYDGYFPNLRCYAEYIVLPMGYSCYEPMGDIAQFVRKRRTTEYQQIMSERLADREWCELQYQNNERYVRTFDDRRLNVDWRRPLPLVMN